MFKILFLILISVFLYKAYQRRKTKEQRTTRINNSKLGMQHFNGISDEPQWWEFSKKAKRKKEIERTKQIFFNSIKKGRRHGR